MLDKAIGRNTKLVAKALGIGPRTLRAWKERPETDADPDQSGIRNILDRFVIITETLEQIDPARAYLMLEWLAAKFGFMPLVKMPDLKTTDADLTKALLKWTGEIGESAQEISKTLEDGEVTKKEYQKVFKELREDLQAGQSLLAILEEKVED